MTEYRLENGHKVEAGKFYKTRNGSKAFVSCLGVNIYGMIMGSALESTWYITGKYFEGKECPNDLISLWPSEKDIYFTSEYECGCEQNIYADKKGGNVEFCKEHIPNLLGERFKFWEGEKIEVTDEIMEVACKAYYETRFSDKLDGKQTYHIPTALKTALEAVFAHIANQPEKPDSSIFCDCNLPGCWYCASEHKRRGLQDNDGWIEWLATDSLQPPVPATTRVQVKGSKGNRYENEARNFCWGTQTKEFIIAYRIISEPKEEKQDIDKLSDQIQSITDQVLEITNMIETITEGIKEPKKQTLLEFAFRSEEKLSSTILLDNLKPTRIFEIISRYLEQNK